MRACASAQTSQVVWSAPLDDPWTALLLAWFASKGRSLLAAQCLVEAVLQLYMSGTTFAEIQVRESRERTCVRTHTHTHIHELARQMHACAFEHLQVGLKVASARIGATQPVVPQPVGPAMMASMPLGETHTHTYTWTRIVMYAQVYCACSMRGRRVSLHH